MIFNIFVTIIIFLVTSILVYFEVKRLKLSRQFKHIPSVKEFPIIGTRYFFTAFKMTEFKRYIEEMVFAPVCKIFIGPLMILIISDPEMLHEALNNTTAFSERPFFMRFAPWRKGLLSCKYKYWKRIRRVANPAFSNRASISLIPLINKHYAKYEEELSKLMNGPAFDLFEVSANISYKQFIDSTFKASKVVEKVPRNTINQLIDVGMDRIRMPWLYPENIWKLSKGSKIMDALAATVDDHFIPAVKDQMAQPDVNGVNFVDIMSRELKNEEQLSFEEIYDNAITMINAGFETTALSISYACLALAMQPDIDAKVEEELRDNIQLNEPLDYEVIKRLPYLDMVTKETLRLFVPAPFIPREALYDVEIKGIGLIPKGTIIGQVFYSLHRWKHIWGPDAEIFNPNRWLPEEVAKRHPSSFMPFGSGPRQCIGMQQAMISVKLALVHILSKFKFTTDLKLEDLTFKFAMSLRLNQKHMVRVHRRNL